MFSAYDVGIDKPDAEFPFGIGSANFARELHALADRIAAGKIAVQKVRVKTVAKNEDFPLTHLHISCYEPREKNGS
jgi:hypothetical protein